MFRSSFLLFAALLFLASSCQQSTEDFDPMAYDYQLATVLMDVQRELYSLSDIMAPNNKPNIHEQIEITKKQLKESLIKVQSLPKAKEDFQYRKTVLELLGFYQKSLEKYYPEIIRVASISRPTEEEEDWLEDIYDKMEDIEEPIDDKITSIRKKFAEKYNLTYTNIKDD